MHAVHTTPGFIIDSRSYGEADKLLSIFTRDLGLVTAVATGIRLEKSKLRYFAQDYHLGNFSLVRGKDLWRLISAQNGMGKPTAHTDLVARIALLLRRLLQGEEAHPELFACVEELNSFLIENPSLDKEKIKTLESLVVLRLLHLLGYVNPESGMNDLLSLKITRELLDSASSSRVGINQHINKALKESHL